MKVRSKLTFIKQNLLGEYGYGGKPFISKKFRRVFNNDSYTIAYEALWKIFWLIEEGEKFGPFQKFEYLGVEFVILDEIGYVSVMLTEEYN